VNVERISPIKSQTAELGKCLREPLSAATRVADSFGPAGCPPVYTVGEVKEGISQMKLKSILFVGAILALAAVSWAADTHPDFSGTWKADIAKSDFGPMGGPDEQTNVIEHKDPKLKIKSIVKGGQRPGETEANYMTDGTESVNKRGQQDVKTVAKWDGAKLVMNTKLSFQGADINIKATYELAADGKTMTISSVISAPQGEFESKIIFNKSE
jgi:hypothetical protein